VVTIANEKLVDISEQAEELGLFDGIDSNGTVNASGNTTDPDQETEVPPSEPSKNETVNCTQPTGNSTDNSTAGNGTSPCTAVVEEEEQTTVFSTVTQFEKAYNWYVDNENIPHYLYAVIECTNQEIELQGMEGLTISRQALGIWTVVIDFFIMLSFLIALWTLTFLVKVDSERHRSLFFETKEFSVMIGNLPTLSESYTIEQMKAELWDHVYKIVRE